MLRVVIYDMTLSTEYDKGLYFVLFVAYGDPVTGSTNSKSAFLICLVDIALMVVSWQKKYSLQNKYCKL